MDGPDPEDDEDDVDDPDVVEVPIGDSLDLHTFHPRDVKDLVAHYLDEAQLRGFGQVRIIHGKGTGTLRRIVHSVLDRHPAVDGHAPDTTWGATIVRIKLKNS